MSLNALGILEQTFPTEHEDLCVSERLGLTAAAYHCSRSHLSVWDLWQPLRLLSRYQRYAPVSTMKNVSSIAQCVLGPETTDAYRHLRRELIQFGSSYKSGRANCRWMISELCGLHGHIQDLSVCLTCYCLHVTGLLWQIRGKLGALHGVFHLNNELKTRVKWKLKDNFIRV